VRDLRAAADKAWAKVRRFLCALVGHGNAFTRINDGPWTCDRCGGIDEREWR
jgi:hypothetical protein